MNISELVDVDFLRKNIAEGFISERVHKDYDLTVLNYTPAAAYARNWNAATRICRGMVVGGMGEIIARPFPKFFNLGEPDADLIEMDEMVSVLDKADGSLLIVFKYMDDIVVATRGSFYSEQADLARQFMNAERYDPDTLDSNTTYLMEVVGPDNRIVLNYESNHLIRIADVDNLTGAYSLAPYGEPFIDIDPVQTFGLMSKSDALEIPARANAEGLVLYTLDGRVQKIKQSDYIELHRLVFSLSKRRVWEQMMEKKTLEEIKEPLPDEFYDLVEQWHEEVQAEWLRITTEVWDCYWGLCPEALDASLSRKDFALLVKDEVPREYHGYMFKIHDGNVIAYDVLRTIRPKEDK